jgi:ADP-ribose pyrophosphatase
MYASKRTGYKSKSVHRTVAVEALPTNVTRSWNMNNRELPRDTNEYNPYAEARPQTEVDMTGRAMAPVSIARTQLNPKLMRMAAVELGITDLQRQPVPEGKADWDVPMPEYDPPVLDLPRGATSFRKEGDAPDDSDPSTIAEFKSLEVQVVRRAENGAPLNPLGRTGLRGRGILDKWGATEAADPVVTRINPQSGNMEVLAIQRSDTDEWAFPGGKVDSSETAAIAAGRELVEEAGIRGVSLEFSQAETVYAGYIDDSRNTDNAWMESTALHVHVNANQAALIATEAGSDAAAVRWIAVSEALAPQAMFAPHAAILGSIMLKDMPTIQ